MKCSCSLKEVLITRAKKNRATILSDKSPPFPSTNVVAHLKLTLRDLIKHINRLSIFGNNPNLQSENKVLELKKILVEIYSEYVNSKPKFDEKIYLEEPEFKYEEIRNNLSKNFPDSGLYHVA
jgi:hypothetical protein